MLRGWLLARGHRFNEELDKFIGESVKNKHAARETPTGPTVPSIY
jgi:hypothetical protein